MERDYERKKQIEKPRCLLLIGVCSLTILAIIAIFLDTLAWREKQSVDIRVFQQAVGGLGMGAIATPMWQFINYDNRVLSVDDSMIWPVPGGYSYGPDRMGTISYFEEIPENQWIIHP